MIFLSSSSVQGTTLIKPRPFPSTSLPIHFSSVIQPSTLQCSLIYWYGQQLMCVFYDTHQYVRNIIMRSRLPWLTSAFSLWCRALFVIVGAPIFFSGFCNCLPIISDRKEVDEAMWCRNVDFRGPLFWTKKTTWHLERTTPPPPPPCRRQVKVDRLPLGSDSKWKCGQPSAPV